MFVCVLYERKKGVIGVMLKVFKILHSNTSLTKLKA